MRTQKHPNRLSSTSFQNHPCLSLTLRSLYLIYRCLFLRCNNHESHLYAHIPRQIPSEGYPEHAYNNSHSILHVREQLQDYGSHPEAKPVALTPHQYKISFSSSYREQAAAAARSLSRPVVSDKSPLCSTHPVSNRTGPNPCPCKRSWTSRRCTHTPACRAAARSGRTR